MKTLKNSLALLLVFAVIFSVAACGKGDGDITTTTAETFNNNFVQDNVTNMTETLAVTVFDNNQNTTYAEVPATENTPTEIITQAPETEGYTPPATVAPQVSETVNTNTEDVTGVGSYSSTYQGVEQTVFYPKKAENGNDVYPVVVFANGTGFDYKIYENLLIKIAEGGYIVVANSETMAADGTAQRASLDFIISENGNSGSVLYKNIDTNNVAAAGHSQGGRSAVNAAAADSRFDCVISFAGSNFPEEAEKLYAPALFMAGTRDMIVNADKWVKPAYDVCKGPAVYVSLVNGIHTSCCSDPETYTQYAIEWLNIWLKNDTGAKVTFRGGGELSKDGAWTEFSCKGI